MTVSNQTARRSNPFASRMLMSTLLFLGSCLLWTASFVAVDKAHLMGWLVSGSNLALLAVVVTTALGLLLIAVFIWHLNTMDELQQRVQLHAMGLSLGLTLVGSFSYSLLVTTGFVQDPELKPVILLLTGSYILGLIAGQVKYR